MVIYELYPGCENDLLVPLSTGHRVSFGDPSDSYLSSDHTCQIQRPYHPHVAVSCLCMLWYLNRYNAS